MTYSPFDLLPAPEPRTANPPLGYFYNHVVKHLVRDTVRIMNNGLAIDLSRVGELEVTLDDQLANVTRELESNPYIQKFLAFKHQQLISEHIAEQQSKLRSPSYYLKPFKPDDMVHRSYFMYFFAAQYGLPQPSELLPSGIPKWTAAQVKKFSASLPVLQRLLNKELSASHPIVVQSMDALATHKADYYNQVYLQEISSPQVAPPSFNPASAKQKQELFDFLDIVSEEFSDKTGAPVWNRDQIERINKESADEHVIHLTQCFLDHSFANIIRTNFIESFYTYTVDGRLYGNYKLFGAKSFRYTSNSPNLLNAPSTGSPFAKPVKRCFVAPPGKVIYAIDLAALEDRVIASLSRDPNKCALFLENLDGHSLSATYYYPDRVAAIIGPFTNNKEASIRLKEEVDNLNKEAKAVRQDSKPVSFGLAYGAFPPKVAKTIKIPIEQAEAIFNSYHHELYPGITRYREEYVLPTALDNKRIHLGLGCYLYSDNPRKDIRTLSNATVQFWSIITVLTINKLHQQIDLAGYADSIKVVSTIYDSIYLEVDADPFLIQWLNDRIVQYITQDFMVGQTIHNDAEGELGVDWASLHALPKNATIDQIQELLDTIFEKDSHETT